MDSDWHPHPASKRQGRPQTQILHNVSPLGVVTAALFAFALAAQPAFARESDAQIKQKIIQQSIDSYPGNCPCPDNRDRAGRRCGARSAYNKPGGYAPKCYPSDVSAAEVAAYRRR
jgi:hypothetical protein